MVDSSYYTEDELQQLGLARVGRNVRLDRSVRLFGVGSISIGDNVRIDCYCVLSAGQAGIEIGDFVHIGVGVRMFGTGGQIVMGNFSGLSADVSVYTSSDDYLGGYLTNPTVPERFRNLKCGNVMIRKHAIVGAKAVILPGVELAEGSAVGALTLVRKNVLPYSIVSGNPAKVIGLTRNQARLADLEQKCLESFQ